MKFVKFTLVGLSVAVLGACGGSSNSSNVINCNIDEENTKTSIAVAYDDKKIVETIEFKSENMNIAIEDDEEVKAFEKQLNDQFKEYDGAVSVKLTQDKTKKVGTVLINIEADKLDGEEISSAIKVNKDLKKQIAFFTESGFVCDEIK